MKPNLKAANILGPLNYFFWSSSQTDCRVCLSSLLDQARLDQIIWIRATEKIGVLTSSPQLGQQPFSAIKSPLQRSCSCFPNSQNPKLQENHHHRVVTGKNENLDICSEIYHFTKWEMIKWPTWHAYKWMSWGDYPGENTFPESWILMWETPINPAFPKFGIRTYPQPQQ
jgi:hypothetical protein